MKNIYRLVFLGLVTVVASCSNDDNQSSNPTTSQDVKAVIATVASDFSSGAHSVVSEDSNGSVSTLNDLLPTSSDITMAAYGKHFYRIERAFAGNNITKFSIDDPQSPIWQYSTNDAGSAVSSDPHDIVFLNETKAYVMRYGTSKIWIVNPAATTEAEFKIGEIDLSDYADSDGLPEMESAVIVDGKLYVILQRLESFVVTQSGYVAIIDTASDTEIDANILGDTLKGIPLLNRNPTSIIHEPKTNSLFVQSAGSFFPEEFTGGIEQIDLSTYSTTSVLDDGDDMSHPYGLITELAVVSDTLLYFVGYAGFTDNTLYRMNLTTMEIEPTVVTSLLNSQISSITSDGSKHVWVGDSANATVRIVDSASDTEVDALSTNLNPEKIVLID